MARNAALYEIIYRDILADINTGKLSHGARFPTLMQLCEQYDIGRNTARSVMQRLAENGYVLKCNRKQALVNFNLEEAETRRRHLCQMARRRKAQYDVFETLALIMPDTAAFCVNVCSDAERLRLADKCAGALKKGIHSELELFCGLFEVYDYALSRAHNGLLEELLAAMYQFILVPLTAVERSSAAFRMSLPVIQVFLQSFRRSILERDERTLKRRIIGLCLSSAKRSDNYLARVCAGLPETPPEKFVWLAGVAGRSREYLYASLISDVLLKIHMREYVSGDSLPSYAELAARYQVSEKTSRRAVKVLERLGIVHTANGKHAQIASFPYADPRPFIRDPFVQRYLTVCLEGIQLMALFAPPVVMKAMGLAGERPIQTLLARGADNLSMEELLDPFFLELPSPCLQEIYGQLKRAITWSHLLDLIRREDSPFAHSETARRLLLSADAGPAQAAAEISELFVQTFRATKEFVGKFGLSVQIGL